MELTRKFVGAKDIRAKFVESIMNLGIDREELIILSHGSPVARVLPIFKEEREKIREEMLSKNKDGQEVSKS